MSLQERISFDLKNAMKNADSFRVGVLRLLSAAFQNEVIAKRAKQECSSLAEEDAIIILKREAKKRKESIDAYSKANRADLADNEEKELQIIREYLPPELSSEEIEIVIRRLIDSGMTDFPSVMKSAIAEFKGAADGKQVAEIIKRILG